MITALCNVIILLLNCHPGLIMGLSGPGHELGHVHFLYYCVLGDHILSTF